MEVLPDDVMIDILSRLPVKTIFHCRRVCKKWSDLVLESLFVNLHLSRSPTGLIIHHNPSITDMDNPKDPGILKLVEIEDKIDHHHLHHDPLMNLHLNLAPILQNSIIHNMGSVNGLICLWQYYPKLNLDNTYICNPITREYMILPRHSYNNQSYAKNVYGFGVSSLTGEYKVVRIFKGGIFQPSVLEAEVYTLGSGQWRSLGRIPYWLNGLKGPRGSFLNDHYHWMISDFGEKLSTFDLNKEIFQLFPSPPPPTEAEQGSWFHDHSLAVLNGCLCKVDNYDSQFTIWVMKEYGIKKSWHKEVVINRGISYDFLEWPFLVTLVEGLKDGSLLTICEEYKLWEVYPQSETVEDTNMFDHSVYGMAYRPSFLKLQNFESETVHMF